MIKKNHIVLLMLLTSATIFSQQQDTIRNLTAETNHSSLLFSVPIADGITRITGKFNDYTIDIDLVNEDIEQSIFRATIQAASIDTGIDGRDEHLRSEDFFNVEKYPVITLISKEIQRMGDVYLMIATMNMHGVEKDIRVPIELTRQDGDNTLGFRARFSVNRVDFGVGSSFKHTDIKNFLAEDIDVELDFWTKKRKQK